MAAGSAAAARERLLAAGYWTGASSANGQPRCGNCLQVRAHPGLMGKTKHDRLCALHNAGVKTHGCCKQHAKDGEPK